MQLADRKAEAAGKTSGNRAHAEVVGDFQLTTGLHPPAPKAGLRTPNESALGAGGYNRGSR
jgi:hypothetical protein